MSIGTEDESFENLKDTKKQEFNARNGEKKEKKTIFKERSRVKRRSIQCEGVSTSFEDQKRPRPAARR